MHRFHSGRITACLLLAAGVAGQAGVAFAQPISFNKSALAGETSDDPTALQFGPDGRLYVAQQNGLIKAYTVVRLAANNYTASATETITLIRDLPNRNDDGTLNPAVTDRQVTGLLVAGTAAHPVLYVSSSDPRIAVGVDTGLDTNSGIVSRLTWDGAGWQKLDLVRGLPRGEENHSVNGMQLDAAAGILYLGVGGNTNMGAPSNNFAFLPEYALSAAILAIDLNAIGETTYDLPTLDDPSRANTGPGGGDENDPFGGNNGANQAVIVPGGPVQVHSPGYRNPYDLVLTADGRLFSIDNGPNAGWGGPPVGEGPAGSCSNAPNETSSATHFDNLHYIPGPGYYAGHPNPTRANPANTFNGQSPVPAGNPIECDYLAPALEDGALATWDTSVKGMAEYKASNFGGAMYGDLLACGWGTAAVYRIELDVAGTGVLSSTTLFNNAGANPLDVTVQGDGSYLAGTIWVCNHGSDDIVVYEPADLVVCSGADNPALDEDLDGYSNADELDNGTDPCSGGDVPPDFDGDFVSDLNDGDDDNDGVADESDAFAIDPDNGLTTHLPIDYGWGVGEPGFGLLGCGFTGLMINGVDNYLDLFDLANLTAGGAAGKITIDEVPAGTALFGANTQAYAFQFGVNVSAATGPFAAHGSVNAPFFNGVPPANFQQLGVFIGTGDQDNYVALAVAANGGAGGILFTHEVEGNANRTTFPVSVLSAAAVELFLIVDPVAATVQPAASVDGAPRANLGAPWPIVGPLLEAVQGDARALAVGMISSSAGATPFTATWDFLKVTPEDTGASATVTIDPSGDNIDGSTYGNGSFVLANNSTSGQQIERVVFDLTTALLPDLVFDPDGMAGDVVAKPFQVDSSGGTGAVTHSYLGSFHNGLNADDGFDRLEITFSDFNPGETMTFSIDNDPTSIKGTTAPGPNESGSVSGLELSGTRVTVEFGDGSALTGYTFRNGGSLDGSSGIVRSSPPPAPLVEVLGVASTPAIVNTSNQTVRVRGPLGAQARVLVVEAGLFITGLTGPFPNGYDLDPFEANSAIAVRQYAGLIGSGGYVDIPVTLSRLDPATDPGVGVSDVTGLNHIVGVLEDATGRTGASAPRLVLLLDETAECVSDDQCDDGDLCTIDLCDAGSCQFPPVDCGGLACDPATGSCVDCPPVTLLDNDFDGLAVGSNPPGWLDTAAGNSMIPDDALFAVHSVGGQTVFGTDSTATNIHSHYVAGDSATWSAYDFTGRMMLSDSGGAIGVTVLSDYNTSDTYYRLRRLGNVSPFTFHLDQHPFPPATLVGDLETGVLPGAGQWLRFHVQVDVDDTQTAVRANVWPDGSSEPAGWQASAVDTSATRLTAGRVGVWSFSAGSKYWDDLKVVDRTPCAVLFDSDGDGDVDLADLAYFAGCLSGPDSSPSTECLDIADADADGDIDLQDFAAFQQQFTGELP